MTNLPDHLIPMLNDIAAEDAALELRYAPFLEINADLGRRIVSFQADKSATESRWFKYKEGFSVPLMRYIFEKTGMNRGRILEPFAGSGTALFAASEAGMDAVGVELLPSSAEITAVRKLVRVVDPLPTREALLAFSSSRVWEQEGTVEPFTHIKITAGAFSPETEKLLGRYRFEAAQVDDPTIARILRFAALCVLESISYTRKDGQYLRWDWRSGRKAGTKPFDKGRIYAFTEAITAKIDEIAQDLVTLHNPRQEEYAGTLFDAQVDTAKTNLAGNVEVIQGSCLEVLLSLESSSFDGLVTSPPYANRYDYTRTYALELAMLGVDEDEIRRLRQAMLSCTVENREKTYLEEQYPADTWAAATQAFNDQRVLQMILTYLEQCKNDGTLNNTGIPRMVRGYFWESCLMIFESARLLRQGAPFIMVNDNVRYHGAHVPVDLILSDFAQAAGFLVERIWVLPVGKGNSSQQMGVHGRSEIRKCVYVWRKA